MPRLIVVLGDQLSPALASLQQLLPDDIIMLAEVGQEASYVKHHKHKIILLFSAMRHFAATLQQQGYQVCYIKYGDIAEIISMTDAVQHVLAQHPAVTTVIITECGEYRLQQEILSWQQLLTVPVTILGDDRFICDLARFARWAKGKKQLRMEYFYRDMRRYTGLLMQGDKPEGGKWNYDSDNRKAWPEQLQPEAPLSFAPDAITAEVAELVQQQFAANMGRSDNFSYAVTGKEARAAFAHALDMVAGHPGALAATGALADPDQRATTKKRLDNRLAALRSHGASAEAAIFAAVGEAWGGGGTDQAAQLVHDALLAAPNRTSSGWTIPIEPLLHVSAAPDQWSVVLTALRSSAA